MISRGWELKSGEARGRRGESEEDGVQVVKWEGGRPRSAFPRQLDEEIKRARDSAPPAIKVGQLLHSPSLLPSLNFLASRMRIPVWRTRSYTCDISGEESAFRPRECETRASSSAGEKSKRSLRVEGGR